MSRVRFQLYLWGRLHGSEEDPQETVHGGLIMGDGLEPVRFGWGVGVNECGGWMGYWHDAGVPRVRGKARERSPASVLLPRHQGSLRVRAGVRESGGMVSTDS